MLAMPSRPTLPSIAMRRNSGYSPLLWYWVIGNKEGLVFSGAAGDYVPDDDPAYLQWIAAGRQPSAIPHDGELADVLANHPQVPAMAVRHAGWSEWGAVPVVRQLNVLVRAGVTIKSNGTPALDGVYPLDDDTRTRINTNVSYIDRNKGFSPNEASTKDWPDVTGALHTFTTTKSYLDFATAVSDYYAGIGDWAANGGTGALPAEPMTIP